MWASAFTGDTGGHKGCPYGRGVYRGIVGAGLVPARSGPMWVSAPA